MENSEVRTMSGNYDPNCRCIPGEDGGVYRLDCPVHAPSKAKTIRDYLKEHPEMIPTPEEQAEFDREDEAKASEARCQTCGGTGFRYSTIAEGYTDEPCKACNGTGIAKATSEHSDRLDKLTMTSKCPKCGADWQDEPIPKKSQHLFGDVTHFSRLIGIENWDEDRIDHWECPDCRAEFKREEVA